MSWAILTRWIGCCILLDMVWDIQAFLTARYVRLSGDRLGDGQTITATVTLTNTGDREGTETVQLYLTDLFGSVVRPVKQLRGFRRVSLQPGESAEVSFDITPDMLSFYNIDMKYTWEPGTCKVNIAGDSATENSAVFELV